jgi:hypothetical protein
MSEQQIYKSISNVTADIVNEGGISKDRKNQAQGYAFRGIEDFLNVLAPKLPKHGIVIIPRMIHRELFERVTAKGTTMYHALAEYEFDFISTLDGSKVTAGPIVGEAMDSGDKANNKTLSMAYKYAVMMTFCIPTAVDDADEHSPEPTQRQPQQRPVEQPKPAIPDSPPLKAGGVTASKESFFAMANEHGVKTEAARIASKYAKTQDWYAAMQELKAILPQPA